MDIHSLLAEKMDAHGCSDWIIHEPSVGASGKPLIAVTSSF